MITESETLEAEASVSIPSPRELGTDGINVGGNTVTQATEHLPEDQRLLVRWLHTTARNKRWSWEELSRYSKLSSTVLYRIWHDKYRYDKTQANAGERVPLDGVCDKIARFKRVLESREAIVSTGFVETSVWEKVDFICKRAFTRQKIGIIYGESQVGKTTCLREHERRNDHGQTTYVEMPPSAGVQLMTKHIAAALHVATGTCFEHLLDDVTHALDGSKLLMIDEVHRVFTTYLKTSVMRCLDVLRYLHDRTQCGLVLCGTNVFRDELKQGQFFQYLKQLRRRGLYELQLAAVPPREDLDAVAQKFGLDPADGEAEDLVLQIAKTDGLGKYIIRLTDAAELAAKKKQPLTWQHFVRTHRLIEAMAIEHKEA